jgi:hypothetical protein
VGAEGVLQHDDSSHEHTGMLSLDGSMRVLEGYIVELCCVYGVNFQRP